MRCSGRSLSDMDFGQPRIWAGATEVKKRIASYMGPEGLVHSKPLSCKLTMSAHKALQPVASNYKTGSVPPVAPWVSSQSSAADRTDATTRASQPSLPCLPRTGLREPTRLCSCRCFPATPAEASFQNQGMALQWKQAKGTLSLFLSFLPCPNSCGSPSLKSLMKLFHVSLTRSVRNQSNGQIRADRKLGANGHLAVVTPGLPAHLQTCLRSPSRPPRLKINPRAKATNGCTSPRVPLDSGIEATPKPCHVFRLIETLGLTWLHRPPFSTQASSSP